MPSQLSPELTSEQIQQALQGISVPPQPQIMVDLQMEQYMPDPDLGVIARLISQDPVRLLAVLVVATPCPLILATPIAIISGISRSASRGIIIKNGGALETLAEVKAFIFDKTGTLTLGTPKVVGQKAFNIQNYLHAVLCIF